MGENSLFPNPSQNSIILNSSDLMLIQWYPGHIAKAEKDLKEQLKRVDVVLEVLDARIPITSHHPQMQEWIGGETPSDCPQSSRYDS